MSSWSQPKIDPVRGIPMGEKKFFDTVISWVKVEQLVRMLARRYPVQRLNYAEFTAAPKQSLQRVLGNNFAELVNGIQWHNDRTVLPGYSYHSVNGNPDRYDNGEIIITYHVPYDYLPRRSYALFEARSLLQEIFGSSK